MKNVGLKNESANLTSLGFSTPDTVYWNLSPAKLVEMTIKLGQGSLNDTGALMVDTGEFTGRSPKDKFTVKDNITKDTVWWGDVNFPFEPAKFTPLRKKMLDYANGKTLYVHDAFVCADPAYRLKVRVITETPWANLFANNLFLRPTAEELKTFTPDWHIICLPGFKANAKEDGTRQHNFTMLNFTEKQTLIGGSAYTGEIKKSVFTLLNYTLPVEKGVLSMHCSANVGKDGDTAIFFGLSGTGKTTLSADPQRRLIGDDEHGWSDKTVFNFEGGCYAKCVNLTQEKEPQIFNAIKFGALLENVNCHEGTDCVDYDNIKKTENTRVAYPTNFIENAMEPSIGKIPQNIFFLTCDAHGVLPPISKLTIPQAMYHFISGYTAKVAGTEVGVTEPQLTFSACFGKAFLPLHPIQYADLLGKKLQENKGINVWLVNTGWSGGAYGVGSRMKLSYTRSMITSALNGSLAKVKFETLPVFNLQIPTTCPDVPADILNPRKTWKDKDAYDAKLNDLANAFVKNFDQYASRAGKDILEAAPKAMVNA